MPRKQRPNTRTARDHFNQARRHVHMGSNALQDALRAGELSHLNDGDVAGLGLAVGKMTKALIELRQALVRLAPPPTAEEGDDLS